MSAPASRAADVRPSVVVPGNHDGVHVGHRALISLARERFGARGLDVVALTFDPHPLATVAPERAPTPLTTIPRRTELLRAAGADRVEVARFDARYAAQTAEEWIERELAGRLGARAVVVGVDFRFGKGRGGDVESLRALGRDRGIEVEALGEVLLGGTGERVSSTAVRRALGAGEVELAHDLLGRAHTVDGVVVHGDHRGRTIGFPTANLAPDPILLPHDGVYAVRMRVGERWVDGVANLGTRPTFAAGRSLETHLLDFEGDLYDAHVRLAFVARLRGEQKFSGIDALVAQIRHDVDAAKTALARRPRGDEP